MEQDKIKIDYAELRKSGTGSHESFSEFKIVKYLFDRYEIKIKLSLSNEFIEITEVKFNKDFADFQKKIQKIGYHDVEEFYKDEEE